MFKTFLLLFFIIFDLACLLKKSSENQPINNNMEKECSKFYQFDKAWINLKSLEKSSIKPDSEFKECSKYSHKFSNPLQDSILIKDHFFVIINNKEQKEYELKIIQDKRTIKKLPLPVELPLPEVHSYQFNLIAFNESVILLMSDFYSTHFKLVKYDLNGEVQMQTEIEHTYVTHPEENTNYYHPYLNIKDFTKSQIIFTSYSNDSNINKTILLSMQDFSTKEYAKMANGLIFGQDGQNLQGFATTSEDRDNQKTNFQITMTEGSTHNFNLPHTHMSACHFLKDNNMLYVANYHPISTGALLHCYNLNSNQIEWQADVAQAMVGHSKYSNKVILSMWEDKLLMEGNETYGDYLQIFNSKDGKRLANFGLTE